MTHKCEKCGSSGFEPSGVEGMCTFCDGTFGGNPPKIEEHTMAFRFGDIAYAGMPLMTVDGSEQFGPSTLKLECHRYKVIRHTPKGFWIPDGCSERWVGYEHKKQFASLTWRDALEHYKARKRRQIQIYTARLARAQEALSLAETVNS